ncbi:acyloxyacyl hydrolase [Tenacibaculum amylolyticum]|uniref:acyloxyacyl hydrolase n=1 Tax=Tenacibaculum amylolyticum TaxID=104269 RepID=UPI003892F2CF
MKLHVYLLYFFLFIYHISSSQESKNHRLLIGLNYGQASQNNFILNDPDYTYDNHFLKFQVNYLLSEKNRWKYELTIEPSIYFVKYQLLNEQFVRPETPNYLELRELYTQKRSFNEYTLNLGIIVRYALFKNFSSYVQGSVGPMISAADTERLKKGFAFSDILGLGFSWKQKRIVFDLRFTLRHNSNLDFATPNSGHNSAGIESGILFNL